MSSGVDPSGEFMVSSSRVGGHVRRKSGLCGLFTIVLYYTKPATGVVLAWLDVHNNIPFLTSVRALKNDIVPDSLPPCCHEDPGTLLYYCILIVWFVCCYFAVYSLPMIYWCQMHCCWTHTLVWECTYTVADTCSRQLSHGESYTQSAAQCCSILAILCSAQSPRRYCHVLTPCVHSSVLLPVQCFWPSLADICRWLMITLSARHSFVSLLLLIHISSYFVNTAVKRLDDFFYLDTL